jgi:hypothetical protein
MKKTFNFTLQTRLEYLKKVKTWHKSGLKFRRQKNRTEDYLLVSQAAFRLELSPILVLLLLLFRVVDTGTHKS